MGFQTLNHFYAKDSGGGYAISPKTQMYRELPPDRMDEEYFHYERLEGSDGPSFEVLTADPFAHYARDRRYGWFWGGKMEDCDGPTLEDLGCNFARDARAIFYRGKKAGKADYGTFRRFGGRNCPYAADKEKVFHGEIDRLLVLDNADRGSFTVINNYYAKDGARVYCGADVLPGADPSTFEIVPQPPILFIPPGEDRRSGSPYAKDAAHVYYFEKRMAGADPKTFQYLGQLFTKDDHAVYYAGKLLEEADAATFVYFTDRQPRQYRGRSYDAEDKNYKYAECSPDCELIKIQERDKKAL